MPIDSPLLYSARGGRDGRSPGLATLKEAFDITYAVHRMEEEGARRRAYKGRGGAGMAGLLGGLNEDDEDEDDDHVEGTAVEPSKEIYDGRAGQRDAPRRSNRAGFELKLDGATLLGRRHKRGVDGEGPLARHAVVPDPNTIDAPQSPMHL